MAEPSSVPSSVPGSARRGSGRGDLHELAVRTLVAAVVAALVGLAVVILWKAFFVFLVLFAGVLLAVLLRGMGEAVARVLPLRPRTCVMLAVAVGLGGAFAAAWLLGPMMVDRARQVAEQVPQALEHLQRQLAGTQAAKAIEGAAPKARSMLGGASLQSFLGFFSTLLGAVTTGVVIVFVGIYLAVEPRHYTEGVARLAPPGWRDHVRDVLTAIEHALRWWLVGQMSAMAIVGILVAIGLGLLGVPLWGTFAVLSALLAFVPYVGPLVSMLLPAMVAFVEGPWQALWVVVIYLGVQTGESYVITPMIQRRAVSLPPALVLLAQVFGGVAAGALGVALATPLAVLLIVLVKVLYVEDVLGGDEALPGQH